MAMTGRCFCGAVSYRIDGTVFDARSCHCSRCRKAFSAQASAYALVQPDQFSWTSGEDLLTTYVGAHGAGKQFCRVCGSMLCGVVAGQIHGVALGCLDEDAEIELQRHIYVGSKAQWETIGEGVPQYDEAPPE
ncbi:GFA family protein [Magnetococcus sp. PR-3]|uniref:GFA family protein n=1 Tax=Magnetococcus sp. PR-3 TaxID=3120355 RepID=UPI002FCE346C